MRYQQTNNFSLTIYNICHSIINPPKFKGDSIDKLNMSLYPFVQMLQVKILYIEL